MHAQNRVPTLPISTRLTIKSTKVYNNNNEILNVFLINNRSNQSHGTGFLLSTGQIITCEHVVKGARLSDIDLRSPRGQAYAVKSVIIDSIMDIAVLTLYNRLQGGFELSSDSRTNVGDRVYTWGFPYGYGGPSPLLSVGYVSGINVLPTSVKHFVINGAFNPGNSGGPLIDSGKIIGIVQSKALPITAYISSALNALKKNQSGVIYSATDDAGRRVNLVEGQVIEQILQYYQSLAQVMIGEAVTVDELKKFLKGNNIAGY